MSGPLVHLASYSMFTLGEGVDSCSGSSMAPQTIMSMPRRAERCSSSVNRHGPLGGGGGAYPQ